MERIDTQAKLWRWQSATAPAAWYFLTIDGEAGDAVRIAAMTGQWIDGPKGFGSAKVTVQIGDTRWKTSVFPDKASGGWFLPVKKAVRTAEGIEEGDIVSVSLLL